MPGSDNKNDFFSGQSNLLYDLPLVIYHFLPGHKVVFANRYFFSFFKVPPDNIIDSYFSPDIHPDDTEIFENVIGSLSPGNGIENFSCRIILPGKDTRWTEWRISSLMDDRGLFRRFQAIIIDLTEKRKTELALKRSEQKYQLAFDQAADMIVIIDKMGNFLDLNEKFEIESGWKREEMIGKNVFTSNILTRESSHKVSSHLNILLAGEESPSFEIQGIRKDGTVIDYEIRAVPIIQNKLQIAFQAILRNISDRKNYERALRESQRQLSNLMSNLPGMAYRCKFQENWEMEFVSEGSFELTGYHPDQLIRNKVKSYAEIIHEQDRDLVYRSVRDAVDNKRSFRINYRIITSDSKIKWVLEQGSGVRNDHGAVEAVEGFITDITDQKRIQEALRENEELYRKLIATLPDMIVISDLEGRIVFMNDLGIRLSGYSGFEDVKRKSIFDFIETDDRNKALKDFGDRFSRKLGSKEYKFVNKLGKVFEFEVNGEILKTQDSKPYGMIFSCRDITSRKKAEIELARSEEKYRTLIDSMQDGVFLIQDGRISFVNEAFAQISGHTVQELLGLEFSSVVADEDRELVISNYRKRMAGGDAPSSYEWRIKHKNGSDVFVNMNVRLIDYQGRIASIGTIKDISLKKKIEAILLRQQKILYGVSEASNILLVEEDFSLAIKHTLAALGESTAVDRVYIFENSTDEVTGLHFMSQRYEWTAPGIEPQIDNPDLQMLPYDPYFSEWYKIFLNGGYVWSLVKDLPPDQKKIMEEESILSILEVPVKIKDRLWGFIGFDDCSTEREWTESEISVLKAAAASIGGAIEREKTNSELLAAKENAEAMNRLKSNFLANMSHELRTPLIGILGYAELMSNDTDNPEWKEMLETIYSGGERLLETLNHLLDLSKIEADKVSINLEAVDVNELVKEVTSLFVSVATRKNIFIKYVFKDKSIICNSDSRLLRSILNNLVGNALKFTEKGGVTVETELNRAPGKNFLVIRVVDTGVGIPDSGKHIIYDEFRQASEGLNRHYEGTGLGLTITKKFVELLNGKIDFTSEFGSGTTFIVSVPVELENSVQEETAPSMPEVNVNDSDPRLSVIVVDDDAASRSVISLFLRKEFSVDSVATGEEAIIKLQQKKYDLVLLDISLGKGINGLDLIRLLRKKPEYAETPVVAVTAHAMVGDKEKFLREGFDDYIAKPFTKLELADKIKHVLR